MSQIRNKHKKKPNTNVKKKDNIKPKKTQKKRTIFTLVAMANIMWYTIVVLVANFFDHDIQAELTVAWFSAWTVELALLFGIKVSSKSDSSDKEPDISDSEDEDDDSPILDDETSDDGGVG